MTKADIVITDGYTLSPGDNPWDELAALGNLTIYERLAGAVVDVVSTEPIAADNPLLSASNIAITPHLAWATREARRRLMSSTAENIKAFMAGEPQNVVNAMYLAPG